MDKLYTELLDVLEKEDRYASIKFVTDALTSEKIGIVDMYEKILGPAMNKLECKLSEQKLCIWKEHVRSSIMRSIIECCYPFVIKERDSIGSGKNKGKAIVFCPDGEYHEIGARMVSDFFTMCGFESIFIGSSTPKEEFINILDVLEPTCIAISVTNYYNLVSAKRTIAEIRKSAKKDMKIVAGGNAFIKNTQAYKEIGADAMVNTFEDIKAL